MSEISDNLSNEQIVALLQMLFTNMNNLDKLYYDMFINTTPLTLTLERYNESGVLETFELPNRAKDRVNVLQGKGEPEKMIEALPGTIYLDILGSNVWVKVNGSGNTGWVMIYTPANLLKGRDYLAPNGDGSNLTGISTSSMEGGILGIRMGGTGVSELPKGILKGNGINPLITADVGLDYAIPKTYIGMIGLFLQDTVPEGWLKCDGSLYNIADYQYLYNHIRNSYPYNTAKQTKNGVEGYYTARGGFYAVPDGQFRVPDFRNQYIKGWDGNSSIGKYGHSALPNITGGGPMWYTGATNDTKNQITGAFYLSSRDGQDVNNNCVGDNAHYMLFDASRSSSLYKSGVKEVDVEHTKVVFCIYAGPNGYTEEES